MNKPSPSFPGRLRLRFSQLRRDPIRLSAVCLDMRAVNDVLSVEESPLTGGLLIQYVAGAGTSRRFWDDIEAVLLRHHLQHDPRPLKRQVSGAGPAAGHRPGDGIAQILVDKLIERSAMALVAALL